MKKIALVTGGTKGIGKQICLELMDEYHVIACARNIKSIDIDNLIEYVICDISNSKRVSDLVNGIIERWGNIDLLVNNAGISELDNGKRKTIEKISDESWSKTMNINLSGAFYMCREVLPFMKECNSGKIVNISSASARFGGELAGVDYIASKSGLIGLTKGLAYELKGFNIHVNAIAPGRIETDMTNKADVEADWARNNIPLGRLGRPREIAKLVKFLGSDDSSYIHGATIDCNGGWVIN
ncbi:SDR family NAD(P)-dependent oxidoreductase [Vibrio mimicus]|uniref:SDR family NAD(P)-dependent oxidoreductase n=1 Tax=Vibrio mimicus TaxID=674 RepID=UPI002F932CD7